MSNSTPSVRYVKDSDFNWTRRKSGKGFRFLTDAGEALPPYEVTRIKKLVIPPAWAEVRICADECGHIQAVGFDAKGRKQYIYHPQWALENQQHKFERMIRFGEILPTIRDTVAGHMRQQSLTRERVLATVVWLLEHTFIRVGNQEYAKANHSYGLTTLRAKHVDVEGNKVTFSFKGKSGVFHDVDIRHPRIAKTLKQMLELPGYEIFQYLDDDKQRHVVDSRDVNEYLQTISGESLSAKDFRTWGGSTLAGDLLFQMGRPETEADLKRNLTQASKEVSKHLRNTLTVCRKYYIHPAIISTYTEHKLVPHYAAIYDLPAPTTPLSIEEEAVWTLLKKRSKSK